MELSAKCTRPGPEAEDAACQSATNGRSWKVVSGVGTGATVGKLLQFGTKSGLGNSQLAPYRWRYHGGSYRGRAIGDVVDPATGVISPGSRNPNGQGFVNTMERLHGELGQTMLVSLPTLPCRCGNGCSAFQGVKRRHRWHMMALS